MLGYIFLFIILMSVLTVFFVRGLIRIMGKYGGESIARLHRDSECITNRGMVPPDWVTPWLEKIKAAEKKDSSERFLDALKEKARLDCLKKMDKLIVHFKRTSIIEDEEVRGILIRQLSGTREKWQKQNWEELI